MRSAEQPRLHKQSFLLVEDIVYSPNKYRETEGIKDANDPSAFMHVKVDRENKKIYILEEYVRKGLLNNQIAEAVTSLGYSKEVIMADSAEQKSIAELQTLGLRRTVPVGKGKGSVLQGVQFMQQFDIIVDERCVKTIEELENYTWQKDKRTNEYINKPCDSYNHCIDAIRYALQNLIFAKDNQNVESKIKTINRLMRR